MLPVCLYRDFNLLIYFKIIILTYDLVYLLSNLTIFNTSFLNSQLLDRRSFLLTVAEATHVWTEVPVRTWNVHVLRDSVEICVIQVRKSIWYIH